MYKLKFLTIFIFSCTFIIANELTDQEKEALNQRLLRAYAQEIWTQSMNAKEAYQNNVFREEYLSNLASSAPRQDFIVNADISDSLAAGNPTAEIFVSTDGQSTWYNTNDVNPLNEIGFENTWGATITTDGGTNIAWYLKGEVDAAALGFDYPRLIVTGAPKNINSVWPPGNNLYAVISNDESGDTGSGQDILNVKGTYSDDRLYFNLDLNGGCCDEGGLFGPWYLYGIGIVNPEAESEVAFAVGYGNGGFGQLTPGLLKITGDLATGEVGGFDYITTDIEYTTSGNQLQASVRIADLIDDPDWGIWPNSVEGVIGLGVTVQADISLNVEVKDQTTPGLMILTTSFQEGNIDPVLSDPAYDPDSMELSVTYTDEDGNLPWWRNVQVCYPEDQGGVCFLNLAMTPNSHNYLEGVRYSSSIFDEDIDPGDYVAKFWFSDDMPGSPQTYIDISIGGGNCGLLGDSNSDGQLNVLDVVLLVNLILSGDVADCSDLNEDGQLNVLDIVLLVNLILTP